jgi:hypothetical protein
MAMCSWVNNVTCSSHVLLILAEIALASTDPHMQAKKPLQVSVDEEKVVLRARRHPFSDKGATRLPYHANLQAPHGSISAARLGGSCLVAKLFRDGSRAANTLEAYQQQMEVQSVATVLAQQFNEVCLS